jgi:hypothetical protein
VTVLDAVRAVEKKLEEMDALEDVSRESQEVQEKNSLGITIEHRLIAIETSLNDLYQKVAGLPSAPAAAQSNPGATSRVPEYSLAIVGALVVLILGVLVYYGWAQKPTIAISYNIGEIIGALLVGASALVASIAYAFPRRGE